MLRRILAGTAIVAAFGLASVTPAAADGPPQPTAAYLGGAVVTDGWTATVRVFYTCTSTESPLNHLFVALKQGPEVNTTDHSSSEFANSFLSTNWNSDAGPNALTCDGKRHLQNVVLKQQPGFDGLPLATGTALVQICVFDNVTGFTEDGEPIGGFAPSYTMEHVVNTAPHA